MRESYLKPELTPTKSGSWLDLRRIGFRILLFSSNRFRFQLRATEWGFACRVVRWFVQRGRWSRKRWHPVQSRSPMMDSASSWEWTAKRSAATRRSLMLSGPTWIGWELRPGQFIRFREVTIEEAEEIGQRNQQRLATWIKRLELPA